MSKCVDMGSGVHCAPTGVLYIDGRPYEIAGVPRFSSTSEGVDQFEMTVVPREFSFTIGRPSRAVVLPGAQSPEWLQSETYENVQAFARELSACSAIPLGECMQAVLNAIAPVKRELPKRNRLPKPSTTPPMWAHDPARTRRSRNRATNIRTPKT